MPLSKHKSTLLSPAKLDRSIAIFDAIEVVTKPAVQPIHADADDHQETALASLTDWHWLGLVSKSERTDWLDQVEAETKKHRPVKRRRSTTKSTKKGSK